MNKEKIAKLLVMAARELIASEPDIFEMGDILDGKRIGDWAVMASPDSLEWENKGQYELAFVEATPSNGKILVKIVGIGKMVPIEHVPFRSTGNVRRDAQNYLRIMKSSLSKVDAWLKDSY